MGRKECLVSYVDHNQNLVCFRLTTENTFKSLEKVLEFAQYLKERYNDSNTMTRWRRNYNWFLISNLSIVPISNSQFRFIPSATSIRYHTELANRVLRYGRSYWERYQIQRRITGGY